MARVRSFIPDSGRERFASPEGMEAFFRVCDHNDGPENEPDRHEHLEVMAASRAGGASGTRSSSEPIIPCMRSGVPAR